MKASLIYSIAIMVAVFVLLVGYNLHEKRITALEVSGKSCSTTCRPMSYLLSNRRIGKVHSFARPFDICEP